MKRPRLFIPLSLQFCVRSVVRTGLLAKLVEHTHPIILLAWEDAHLSRELIEAGAEVHQMPQSQRGQYYSRIRRALNYSFERRLASPSTELIRKHKRAVRCGTSANSLR